MTDPFDFRVRRREALRAAAAGGVLLAAGLSGCKVSSGPKGDTERRVEAKIDGDLTYFNWAEYMDPELLREFERRYGVKVRESNFDSMPAMVSKLRSGNRYDLIFPSGEYAARLIQGKQLLRIDKEQVPNVRTLYPDLVRPWYDPDGKYTIPYALYATGLIYRADKVKMTGSWADIANPQAGGRAFLLDDPQEGLGAGNLFNRFDLNTTDEAQLNRTKDWLVSIKPKLRGFSSDTVGNVVSGNALIQHGWNGDTVNIRNQIENPDTVRFQKCSQGVPVGNDAFAIPVNARHPGTALVFINFLLAQQNAARNVAYFGYPMPYTGGAEKAFKELTAGDPSIDVTIEDVAKGKQYENLGAEGRRLWDDTWTEVKAS